MKIRRFIKKRRQRAAKRAADTRSRVIGGAKFQLRAAGMITYPAAQRMIQEQAAARLGFVGHTEVDGDRA